MKRHLLFLPPAAWGGVLLAALTLVLAPVKAAEATLPISVKCSPAVVNLDSTAIGDCLTVHTNLRFSDVNRAAPVTLNGVAAYLLMADNRGNLVAKFRLTTFKACLTPPSATLILTGTTVTGLVFTGSDVVRVVR